MAKGIRNSISLPLVLWGLSAPLSVHCAVLTQMNATANAVGVHVPSHIPTCPDMSKVEEIDKFDFAGSFGLKPDVAATVKATALAAADVKALGERIDSGLVEACGGLAKDLGDSAAFPDGQTACKAALQSIAATKAKLGPNVDIKLEVNEPQCAVDMKAYGDCAARCDAKATAGNAKVECDGALQGFCSGQCQGDCKHSGGAVCAGECRGRCDTTMTGTCKGSCKGTCDGQAVASDSGAPCAGKCEGSCIGQVQGSCAGPCQGTCHTDEGASCEGTCTGNCSVAMQAPKCVGTLKPPQIRAECKAKCDEHVEVNASCTPPRVTLAIGNAGDAQAAAQLRSAIEKNLPNIINVSRGLARNVERLTSNVVVAVKGSQAVVQSATNDKVMGAALLGCIGAPFTNALSTATSITAEVKVSVEVTATASASASPTSG